MHRMLLAGTMVLLAGCGRDAATGPLTPSVSPGQIVPAAGNLELTFIVDDTCTALPDIARSRTYLTSSTVGSPLGIWGATFGKSSAASYSWNTIYQKTLDQAVEWWFSDPEIWELVGPDAYVTVYGGPALIGLETNGELKTGEWPFWGRFTYCPEMEPDDYPECEVPVVSCESRHNRLRIIRR